MDSARCRCPRDSVGATCGVHPACPIHGPSGPDPVKPYVLIENDRRFLKSMRIAAIDTAAIEDVRKADENRFKERR